jgi:cell division protein FtsQ
MSVRAPAEKNYRRPKVAPTKRKASARGGVTWRMVRIGVSALLVTYAGFRAVDLVLTASTLQVRHIVVRGNVRLSAGEVQATIDGLRGSSIVTADLSQYRARLLESPWVASVAMRRLLPSTIEVFVEERRPIGLCRLSGVLYLVDRHGTIIDEFGPQYAEFDLPVVDGLVNAPGTPGAAIDEARAALAARVIDALAARRSLARRVSQIDVSDGRDAVVLLDGDPALLHLGDEQFLERLQTYVDLAPAFRAQFPEFDYADLRFGERVYLGVGRGASRRAAVTPPPAGKRF